MRSMKTENKQHLYCIDGLKGIGACIIAFVWHYQHFAPQNGYPFSSIFALSYPYGWSMVDFFFMLSGFGIMLGYGEKVMNRQISFKDFFLKRLKRLYPLFIFTTGLVLLFEIIFLNKTGELFTYLYLDMEHVLENVLFLQDGLIAQDFSLNAPSWCIPICIACYCMFYFIVYRTKDSNQIIYCFTATAILGAAIINSELAYPILNAMIGRGMASFSIGVLLFYVYKNRAAFNSGRLGYCCFILLIISYLILRLISTEYSGNFILAMTLGFGPMILLSTLFIPWLGSLLGTPVFKYLGLISWNIYLFHFPTQCLIKLTDLFLGLELNYSRKLVWCLYAALTFSFASLYQFFLAEKVELFVLGFFKLKNQPAATDQREKI